jgi:pimeloyl-ACP methyl ester carboxylesterase
MDDWSTRGFDAWAFDFAGYGGSDRYAGDTQPDTVPGRAPEATVQIARVVSHIASATGHSSVAIVAHSWGTIPAALFATQNPQAVQALCLFGPILRRDGDVKAPREKNRLVTVEQQLARFCAEVPPGHAPVLIEPRLAAWGPAYLDSDPDASRRATAAVKIPNGPAADIAEAWSGRLAYDPRDLRCPLLCVRGEWDTLTTDADAAWLQSRASICRDVKIRKGTHLMHLEHSRDDLFSATGEFLKEVA